MSGFAFFMVLAVIAVPFAIYEPATYFMALVRFWPWVAYAAFGWMASVVFFLRRVQELRLKAPGARTLAKARE